MRSFIVFSTLLALTAAAPYQVGRVQGDHCSWIPAHETFGGGHFNLPPFCAKGFECIYPSDCEPGDYSDRCVSGTCQTASTPQLSKRGAEHDPCEYGNHGGCDDGLICLARDTSGATTTDGSAYCYMMPKWCMGPGCW